MSFANPSLHTFPLLVQKQILTAPGLTQLHLYQNRCHPRQQICGQTTRPHVVPHQALARLNLALAMAVAPHPTTGWVSLVAAIPAALVLVIGSPAVAVDGSPRGCS